MLPPLEGARAGDWPAEHQELLLDLVSGWIGLLPEEAAAARVAEIAADLDATRFAWNGPTDGSGAVYYRVQGPRLLVEFSTRDGVGGTGGHYHSIYRNPANEYGGAPMLPPEPSRSTTLGAVVVAAIVAAALVLGVVRYRRRRLSDAAHAAQHA